MQIIFKGALLLQFVTKLVACQPLRQIPAAVYTGLATYSPRHVDVFSFLNNQAALAGMTSPVAGVYAESRYLLKETSVYHAALALPSAAGNFGMSLYYSGFANYHEQQLGVAYARPLGAVAAVGIQFNYYAYGVAGYGRAAVLTGELGLIFHLTSQLNMGAHVYNPGGGRFSKAAEKLASGYSAGLGYDLADGVFISAEVLKEAGVRLQVNAGIGYAFAKRFFARAGILSGANAVLAGAGVAWSNLRIDLTARYHQQLGVSPGLLVAMQFGKASDPGDDLPSAPP